jgi:hypothetical protein
MKTNLRSQNGSLYKHHGAWFVRYSQRISEQDCSANLDRVSKHLGRSKDFRSISDVDIAAYQVGFEHQLHEQLERAFGWAASLVVTVANPGSWVPWNLR